MYLVSGDIVLVLPKLPDQPVKLSFEYFRKPKTLAYYYQDQLGMHIYSIYLSFSKRYNILSRLLDSLESTASNGALSNAPLFSQPVPYSNIDGRPLRQEPCLLHLFEMRHTR